jgi:uncharacterized protein
MRLKVLDDGGGCAASGCASTSAFTVIIKPTHACNIACTYCFISDAEARSRMALETVDKLLERVTAFCGRTRPIFLVWHGGEPMLMGADFYRAVGEKARAYSDYSIRHLMQSNLTLLDDEMLAVVKEYEIHVSTSIDGPRHVHDAARVDRKGRGSFDKVMDAVERMRAQGLFPRAISVLSGVTKRYIDDIYDFFKAQKMSFRLSNLDIQGRARLNLDPLALTQEDYGRAMIQMFDRWFYDDNPGIYVDPLDTIISNILTGEISGCDYKRTCHDDIVSIAPDGTVYPCGKFSGDEPLAMGNIHQHSIAECMRSEALRPFRERVPEAIPQCATCEYQEICNAGCPVGPHNDRRGLMVPDTTCRGRKALFSHILGALEKDFDRVASTTRPESDAFAGAMSALAMT